MENDKNIKQYPCGVLWLQKYLTHTKSIPVLNQSPTAIVINYSASVSWECISILTPNNHFIMNLVITLLESKSKQAYLVMKFRLPSLQWNKYGRTINYSADREVWQVILGTHSGKLDCTSWELISASEWVASMYRAIFSWNWEYIWIIYRCFALALIVGHTIFIAPKKISLILITFSSVNTCPYAALPSFCNLPGLIIYSIQV